MDPRVLSKIASKLKRLAAFTAFVQLLFRMQSLVRSKMADLCELLSADITLIRLLFGMLSLVDP